MVGELRRAQARKPPAFPLGQRVWLDHTSPRRSLTSRSWLRFQQSQRYACRHTTAQIGTRPTRPGWALFAHCAAWTPGGGGQNMLVHPTTTPGQELCRPPMFKHVAQSFCANPFEGAPRRVFHPPVRPAPFSTTSGLFNGRSLWRETRGVGEHGPTNCGRRGAPRSHTVANRTLCTRVHGPRASSSMIRDLPLTIVSRCPSHTARPSDLRCLCRVESPARRDPKLGPPQESRDWRADIPVDTPDMMNNIR